MAKLKARESNMNNRSNCKTTTIGNGKHSRSSRNKSVTKKRYRGQGK